VFVHHSESTLPCPGIIEDGKSAADISNDGRERRSDWRTQHFFGIRGELVEGERGRAVIAPSCLTKHTMR
jgi:hypothetical protein